MPNRPSTILFTEQEVAGYWKENKITFVLSLTYKTIGKAYNKNNTSCFAGNTLITDPRAPDRRDLRLRLRYTLPPCPRVQQSTYCPQNMKYYYSVGQTIPGAGRLPVISPCVLTPTYRTEIGVRPMILQYLISLITFKFVPHVFKLIWQLMN